METPLLKMVGQEIIFLSLCCLTCWQHWKAPWTTSCDKDHALKTASHASPGTPNRQQIEVESRINPNLSVMIIHTVSANNLNTYCLYNTTKKQKQRPLTHANNSTQQCCRFHTVCERGFTLFTQLWNLEEWKWREHVNLNKQLINLFKVQYSYNSNNIS